MGSGAWIIEAYVRDISTNYSFVLLYDIAAACVATTETGIADSCQSADATLTSYQGLHTLLYGYERLFSGREVDCIRRRRYDSD